MTIRTKAVIIEEAIEVAEEEVVEEEVAEEEVVEEIKIEIIIRIEGH